MLIVIARAEADPKDVAELRPALDAMMRATWEESGCISYSLSIEKEGGEGEPAVISIAERWADMDSLAGHFRAPHMAEFNRQVAGRVRNLDVHLYEVARELPFPMAA
jgi:quinol monooxygenase YgiN